MALLSLPLLAVHTGAVTADDVKGFRFDLTLAVVGADLGDLGSDEPLSFDVGGLPVSLGAESGGDTGNPGLRAGLNGHYALPLGSGFSLVTTGNLEKTRYLEDSFLGSDRLTGVTSLRFQQGSFRTALEPGINADFLAGTLTTQHLLLEARASRDITDYLAMSLENGWARREHPGRDNAGADLGHGRLGLDMRLGRTAKLGLAYEITETWADLRQESSTSGGPALDLDLAILTGLDLGVSYQYREDESLSDALRTEIDTSHAFGLKAVWQDPDNDYLTFSGGYTLDRSNPAGAERATTNHDGMVNMALKF